MAHPETRDDDHRQHAPRVLTQYGQRQSPCYQENDPQGQGQDHREHYQQFAPHFHQLSRLGASPGSLFNSFVDELHKLGEARKQGDRGWRSS